MRWRRRRRRRLMAWKMWPRCTARPAAIHPRMAAHTDAARSTRCASDPSCSDSSAESTGAGGGARGALPELVKNVAAARIGGRRHRSNTRNGVNMVAANRRTPGAHALAPLRRRVPTVTGAAASRDSVRTAQSLRAQIEVPRWPAPPPRWRGLPLPGSI